MFKTQLWPDRQMQHPNKENTIVYLRKLGK